MFVHHIDYLLKLSRDVHQARRDVEQAKASARVKDALFAALGYEVAETSSRMLKKICKRQKDVAVDIRKDELMAELDWLADETARLRDVLAGLMPHVRTVADRVVRSEQLWRVETIVEQAVRTVSQQCADRDVAVEVAALPDLQVACDAGAIATAIANPLANAVAHSKPGQRVTVSARHLEGDFLIIEIEDQGCGMTPEQISRALSPLDGPDVTIIDSICGLGIPLSRAIMEAHSGKIEIRSMPDRGTTVSIVFPAERLERDGRDMDYGVAV